MADGILEDSHNDVHQPIAILASIATFNPTPSMNLESDGTKLNRLGIAIVFVKFVTHLVQLVKLCSTVSVTILAVVPECRCDVSHEDRLIRLVDCL